MYKEFLKFSIKKLRLRRRKKSKRARREAVWGLIFLSPWLIGFLLWIFLPMVASLLFSFTNYNLIHPEENRWVGLANYLKFFKDPVVRQSTVISLRFALISLPIAIVHPILMAALLNNKNLRAKRFFTTLFYMPYIVPMVSAVYIWQGVMNTQTGWINLFLKKMGIIGPDWLFSTTWIYPALIIIGLWGVGDMMLFHLTAMQGIPTELYEAARIDGAGPILSFLHITLPMITPVIFYNLILSVVGILLYPLSSKEEVVSPAIPRGFTPCSYTRKPLPTQIWAMPLQWPGCCSCSYWL
jgi:multiple sugar transport system permease protein